MGILARCRELGTWDGPFGAGLVILAVGACSEPHFELSTDKLMFTAAHTCAYPQSQEVTATVRGLGNGHNLIIRVTQEGPAVREVSGFQVTSPTTGKALVTPSLASSLGPGVFTSTITVSACVDDLTCAKVQLSGSPRRINVRYEVGGLGVVDEPALYTLNRWEVAAQKVLSGTARLTALGAVPHMVVADPSGVVSVLRSDASGASWEALPATATTTAMGGFAVVSSDNAIYLSGGSNAAGGDSNQVWRFDGTAWTQQTAGAAFSPRTHHAMAYHQGRLYVLGGRTGAVSPDTMYFDDVWASDDEGVTWTEVATTRFTPRSDLCVVSFGGVLHALGGVQGELWRSNDGAVWSKVELPKNTPLFYATLSSGGPRCAVLGDRMYYLRAGPNDSCIAHSVSSTDGVDWQFEPSVQGVDDELSPGAASAGDALYIAGGSYSQQRTIYRSVRSK
jgi:hypothetical protein